MSVALSSNGRIAAVGGPLDANAVGSVWTFVRTGAEWSPQGSKLTVKSGKSQAQFGSSVSLSASGTTALIGAPVDDADVGTAWVFTRSGSSWRQQGKELTAPGKPGTVQFGGSVALSGSGDTALVGGAGDNGEVGTGAVWMFTRSGSAWSHEGTQLTARRERGQRRLRLQRRHFGRRLDRASSAATTMTTAPALPGSTTSNRGRLRCSDRSACSPAGSPGCSSRDARAAAWTHLAR